MIQIEEKEQIKMKISEKRLKQIIKEELRLSEADPPASPSPVETKTQLGDFLIGLGKKLKTSGIKGIDTSEVQGLASLIKDLIAVTDGKTASVLLKNLEKKVEKIQGLE